MTRKFPVLILAGLAACGPAADEPGPGGVSAEDGRALDEAAAELDDQTPATESEEQ